MAIQLITTPSAIAASRACGGKISAMTNLVRVQVRVRVRVRLRVRLRLRLRLRAMTNHATLPGPIANATWLRLG